MPHFSHTLGQRRYVFDDLTSLPAKASPPKSGDQLAGIAAAILDGLLYGAGDAVIGINPASDSVAQIITLLELVDEVRRRVDIPTQSCVLGHFSSTKVRVGGVCKLEIALANRLKKTGPRG